MANSLPLKVQIHRIYAADERTLPAFAQTEATLERLRHRAYELSEARGFLPGNELEDWLSAERELCPPMHVTEDSTGYHVAVDLTTLDADNVEVTATPHAILLYARPSGNPSGEHSTVTLLSERPLRDAYGRLQLETPIRVDDVQVTALDGQLTIVAPKLDRTAD